MEKLFKAYCWHTYHTGSCYNNFRKMLLEYLLVQSNSGFIVNILDG